MQVSRLELEQMAKDGKGRASVVKYLAEQALQGSSAKFEPSVETRQLMAKFFADAVEEWPNTVLGILTYAKQAAERTPWDGNSVRWWNRFRDALPAAAKEIL